MYLVTRKWLHQNSSSITGHGFTRDQIAVLGVAWPPQKGWLSGLIGTLITLEQKLAFESFKLISYKKTEDLSTPQPNTTLTLIEHTSDDTEPPWVVD